MRFHHHHHHHHHPLQHQMDTFTYTNLMEAQENQKEGEALTQLTVIETSICQLDTYFQFC